MTDLKINRTTLGGFLAALDKLESLSPQQRKIVGIIASRRGGLVSRDDLIEELYEGEDGGALCAANVISVHLLKLRKLGLPIVTHRGRGYSWQAGAAAENIEVRRCGCGKALSGGGRKHCSKACRQKDYRDKARKAPARPYQRKAA